MNTQTNLGEHGSIYVSSTEAQSGTVWHAITCVSATVFATITDVTMSRSGSVASTVFPAGCTIYGGFTDFTLTSGSVIAYRTVIA